MKDLILNTPRHQVQAMLTQEQRCVTLKAIEYLLSEMKLGVTISGSDALEEQLIQAYKSIKEAD